MPPTATEAIAPHRSQRGTCSILARIGSIFGVLVRSVQYFSNRSLWDDEVNLALNIVNRSYGQLLQPLDYNQAAPPGFLWVEKLAIQTLGNHEYALRLFPFMAGLMSLVLFHKFAARYLTKLAAAIAIFLFASLPYLVYYATELKQYSSDVMVALLLAWVLIPLGDRPLHWPEKVGLGILGALLIWLSHPSIFVLAGIELAHFLLAAKQRRWRLVIERSPVYALWVLSFVGLYFYTIVGTLANDTLTDSWDDRYPNSLLDIVWLLDALGRFFYNPLGFLGRTDGIAIVAFVVGLVAFYRHNRRLLIVIIAPIGVTVLAAFLEQYPFRERLVLFLTPFFIVIVATGIATLLARPKSPKSIGLMVGGFMVVTLIGLPVARASAQVLHPLQIEEMRPVLAYIKAHQEPGDRLYVYAAGRNQFAYYAPRFGFAPTDYVIGRQTMVAGSGRDRALAPRRLRQVRQEIRQFRGHDRVWFLFARTAAAEETAFLETMVPFAPPLDHFERPGAFAYLYRMKRAVPANAAS